MDCIFCKIANKEIPTEFLYRSDKVIAFKDINPMAPIHILIMPIKHIQNLNSFSDEDDSLVVEVFKVARTLAHELSINDSGYRVFVNNGEDSGQIVQHIHFHLLGGKKLESGC